MHLIVQGKISFDSYEKESILEPTAIVKSKKKIRMDNAPEKRVELHLHTNMSAMDGVSDTKEATRRRAFWSRPRLSSLRRRFAWTMHPKSVSSCTCTPI